jgi:anti-anti-sigma regulatory factor
MLHGTLGQKTNMPVSIKQSDGISLIYFDGAITIPSAAELRLAILQALASGQTVCFDLDKASELDITALQLLWATEREAKVAGLQATVSGDVPECILAAAVDAGFQAFPMVSK